MDFWSWLFILGVIALAISYVRSQISVQGRNGRPVDREDER